MNESKVLLIVAISARALAQCARRASYNPIAVDAFGDTDTRLACASLEVAPDAARGFATVDLEEIVRPLLRRFKPKGIVYGSGFDDCPEKLRRLADLAPLLGASPETVAIAKDPVGFANLCDIAGLLHPQIATVRPPRAEKWLLKRAGGCGGLHIRDGRAQVTDGDYWQQRIKGRAVSLIFTRDRQTLVPLAWSEQWTDPTVATPFRYGGAVGPIPRDDEHRILSGLTRLTGYLGLRGLASADFLDDGDELHLLEINPRPGATLDVFDDDTDPLILRHLSSISGRAPAARSYSTVRASSVVYAKRALIAPTGRWPEWATDLPSPRAAIAVQAPLCMVHAESDTVRNAKSLLAQRLLRLSEFVDGVAA